MRRPYSVLAVLGAFSLVAFAAGPTARDTSSAVLFPDTLLFARTDTVFVPVPPGAAWPDIFDIGIVVVRGAGGRVEALQEEPQSESGDWSLAYRHAFDARGRTTRYESAGRYFAADCGSGVVEARLVISYDSAFRVTVRERTFRDTKGVPVDSVACGNVYEFFDGEPVRSFVELVQRGRAPKRLP